jgi:uncharacterized protein (TIGR00369 family)
MSTSDQAPDFAPGSSWRDLAGDDEQFSRLRAFMSTHIPFNRYLGMQVRDISEGRAVLSLPFKPEFIGDPIRPALHGGTISMLADTAGGAAVLAAVRMEAMVSTIDLRIDYLRPGALLELVAEASLVRLGGRVGVARVQVWQDSDEGNASNEARSAGDDARRLIAEATGVYSVRRPE